MHDYGHYCSLSWSLPVFCQPSFVLSMSSTRASNSQKPKHAICVHHTYLYVVFKRHSKVKFSCATFKKLQNHYSCFVYFYSSWESSLQTIVIDFMYSCLISCLLCDNHAVIGMPSICLIFVEYHVSCYACPSCLK